MDATLKFLTTLAGIVEGVTLDQALRIMEVSEDRLRNTVPPLTTFEGRVQLGRETDVVTDALRASKKIVAIKELRLLLQVKTNTVHGLRECKDAVDALALEFPPTWTPPCIECGRNDGSGSHYSHCTRR